MVASHQQILPHKSTSEPFPWLLAFFRQIYTHRVDVAAGGVELVPLSDEEVLVEALHLAYSYDGLRWTALNHNQPIQAASGSQRIRDPFLRRGNDGNFHLLATCGWATTDMFYAQSTDLIHWHNHRLVPVMGSAPQVRNVWAPEFIFDPAQNNYLVFWSSSSGTCGWDDSRIWCARTDDFVRFSAPRVLFDPGFTVIDATIVPFEEHFYMFFKDERFGHIQGEHRYIQGASATQLEGPYTIVTEAITPSITEGPAVMRSPNPERWYLFYDYCMDNSYGVSVSQDLLRWQAADNFDFPPNARHGSVLAVSESELSRLREHFT